MPIQQMLLGAGAAIDPVYLDDIFSMHQYYGNGGTQNIQNGIDLTQGGLVWGKYRSGSDGHALFDTNTGALKKFDTDSNAAPSTTANSLTAFNANGFSIGSNYFLNTDNGDHMSWTWRKQEKFFDIVSYTGNGSNRTISHNLGSVPGMIIVKRTDSSGHYIVYHRMMGGGSAPQDLALHLVNTNAQQDESTYWNDTAPTSSVFSLGTHNDVNQDTATYVAWIFAHNNGDGIFGPNGNADVIACGGYNGNNSTDGPVINLGWEPQYLLIKRTETDGGQWLMLDALRGVVTGGNDNYLYADNASGESGSGYEYLEFTSTGFQIKSTSGDVNTSPKPYIYLAIRRSDGHVGKPPSLGTDVFAMSAFDASSAPYARSNFPVDLAFYKNTLNGTGDWDLFSRLQGKAHLRINENDTETTGANSALFDYSNGWGTWNGGSNHIVYNYKRYAGLDIILYTGNSTNPRTINHQLGQAPQMIWTKGRTIAEDWTVGSEFMATSNPWNSYMDLNSDSAASATTLYVGTPGATSYQVGSHDRVNGNYNYMAILFSSVSGISKIGRYDGDGTSDGSHEISLGFSPRFLILKCIDGGEPWLVYDTRRGFVAGNNKYLRMNNSDAQSTGDTVLATSTGFKLMNSSGPWNDSPNKSYLYYAHA